MPGRTNGDGWSLKVVAWQGNVAAEKTSQAIATQQFTRADTLFGDFFGGSARVYHVLRGPRVQFDAPPRRTSLNFGLLMPRSPTQYAPRTTHLGKHRPAAVVRNQRTNVHQPIQLSKNRTRPIAWSAAIYATAISHIRFHRQE